MAKIAVIHGPNLNLLGNREPEHYGQVTLADLNDQLIALGNQWGHSIGAFQSNSEQALIDHIQDCIPSQIDFIILNPAAFTHTSIALRDALLAVDKPFLEVHLSNIHRREAFRHHSYFSDIAVGVVTGLGTEGYKLALQYAHHYLTRMKMNRSTVSAWT